MGGLNNSLVVAEIDSNRFKVGLDLLREGRSMQFDAIDFLICVDGRLRISVPSSWQPVNITEENAMNDFDRAKSVFNYLRKESSEFSTLVGSRPQTYCLTLDYGNSVQEFARLEENKFSWI